MKLYLASYRLGEYPEQFKELLLKTTKNTKVALITNALDASTNYIKLTQSTKRDRRDLESLQLEVEDLDLKQYFGKTEQLREKLKEYGAVYVRGGNVFVLRRAYKLSGFDEILKEYVTQRDDFVYAAYSAGMCVLSPSFEGLEIVDKPDEDPAEYPKERISQGLGILQYSVAPHFRSDHPESQQINAVVEYYLTHQIVFVALTDNDVIITDTKNVQNS